MQVHGAMGYSWEVDLHFYMKRAWALAGAWGDAQLPRAPRPVGAVVGTRSRSGRRTRFRTTRGLRWLTPISSMRCGRRSARRRAASPACTRPISARIALKALIERSGVDPGGGRGRGLRRGRHHRAARRGHRAHLLARGRPARTRARHDRRPAVRIVAAGAAFRRAGRDERDAGPGRRGRRAGDEPDPDLGGHACGTRIRVRRPVPWLARLACTLRRPGGLAVPLRGDDRGEMGHQPARDGGVRAREQHDGRSRRSTPAASTARSSRSARCAATRRRGAERRSRRWRRSSHSRRVVA